MMRRTLKKIAACLIAVGLTVSGPISSHARISAPDHATAHEDASVQHYGDLAIEPGEDDCPHAVPGSLGHDDGPCNKCCAACGGVSLTPTLLTTVWEASFARNIFLMRHATLVAHPVPTEPDIPKPF